MNHYPILTKVQSYDEDTSEIATTPFSSAFKVLRYLPTATKDLI